MMMFSTRLMGFGATVSVCGSVYYESSFLYRPEKRVEDYIAQAGETTKRADTSYIFVVDADGSVSGAEGWSGGRRRWG